MTVNADFQEQIKNMRPVASDPNALTKRGGFPFVKDVAARDRAYSLMQEAEEKAVKKGYEDGEVDALMNAALENEISAIELIGDEEKDFMQVQDLMYLFGHRMIGETQNPFERMSEQRLLDMLDEMVREAENSSDTLERGFTSQSGTYKTAEAERSQDRARFVRDNADKLRLIIQSVDNAADMQRRLENG
ncbi:MAG: hypothetical protein ACRBDI_09765 [Alphaproteobacteria bacterium]